MDDSKKMKIGAWCAKDNGNDSWIQVDLGGSKRITFIATQGQYGRNSQMGDSVVASGCTISYETNKSSIFSYANLYCFESTKNANMIQCQ